MLKLGNKFLVIEALLVGAVALGLAVLFVALSDNYPLEGYMGFFFQRI